MAYKDKHIINFGLDEEDYEKLMNIKFKEGVFSIAELFRIMIRYFYNTENVIVKLNDVYKDIHRVQEELKNIIGEH